MFNLRQCANNQGNHFSVYEKRLKRAVLPSPLSQYNQGGSDRQSTAQTYFPDYRR